MSNPIPGVTYHRIYPSTDWDAPGRPSLASATPFVLRTTKPDATNTGAGILRAAPTVTLNFGNSVPNGTWSSPDLLTISSGNLKDRIVNGRVKLTGTNQTVENCIVKGDPSRQVSTGSPQMIDTSSATNALVRYNTVTTTYVTNMTNGIGRRNATIEYNNISGVTDAFTPALGSSNDLQLVIRGNYVHDAAFYAPDPNHGPTPTTAVGGRTITGPWAGDPWNHADGLQVEGDLMTGINFYGNNIVYTWSSDPNISVLPLPVDQFGVVCIKELSCMMLNGGRNLIIEDNWFDGGEYAINNADANVTGRIWRNRFGRQMAHSGSADSTYYALMLAASGLDSGDGTSNKNVWEDTGNQVTRRGN